MPNGGAPMHMLLTPSQASAVVLYCRGEELRIIAREDWEREQAAATPLAHLTADEGRVLERFLRYWLRDEGDGPLYREPGVSAQFDY